MLFQLWVGQSSEFFRRLALLMSPRRGELDSRPRPLSYSSIPRVTDKLHGTLANVLGDLQRSFHFHRSCEAQQKTPGKSAGAQQRSRELSALHTSVRSLQLHLKTLLHEVIILEDELEKLMMDKEVQEITCSGYQDLRQRLQLLQPHVQASGCCWDDTLAQVERIIRRVTGSPETSHPLEEKTSPDPPGPTSVTRIQDRDPVPEEQELEAYVTDSDSEGEWRGASDRLSPWEKERQRQELAESTRVLLELKSVLGIRNSDGERDKCKLLLFSDQAALKAVVQETDSAELSESVREFSCGETVVTAADQDTDTVEESRLFLSDGIDGAVPLTPKVPALSVMERLTEIHGSEAVSFSSALAAQVAARSHTFTQIHEATYEDSEAEVMSQQTDED